MVVVVVHIVAEVVVVVVVVLDVVGVVSACFGSVNKFGLWHYHVLNPDTVVEVVYVT